jgi:hypothetical protein
VKRRLSNGASFRTIKVFYRPDELQERLITLGWKISVHPVGRRFFYATARGPHEVVYGRAPG